MLGILLPPVEHNRDPKIVRRHSCEAVGKGERASAGAGLRARSAPPGRLGSTGAPNDPDRTHAPSFPLASGSCLETDGGVVEGDSGRSSYPLVVEQLGGLDAAFLYCETPGMHMHVCGLLVLDPSTMEGDPYDAIHAMMLGALTKVPLMRKRLASVPLGISRPFWVDDVDFDIVRHLHRAQVDPPGDDHTLARMVGDVASRPLRRDRPLWEAWFIDGLARGNVALLIKMHHATIDGVSGVSIMGRLFDYDAPHSGSSRPADSWRAQPVPSSLALLGRGMRARCAAPLEVARLVPVTVGRVGTTLWNLGTRGDNGHGSVRPFTAPRDFLQRHPDGAPLHGVHRCAPGRLQEGQEILRREGQRRVGGGDGWRGRRYLEDRGELPLRPLNAAEPVSVHGRTGGMKGVTKLSVIFSTLATDVEDPAERLRTVAAANVRAKQTSAPRWEPTRLLAGRREVWPNALSWGARLYSGLRLAEHHGVVFNLLLSNVTGPPFALYLAGGHVVGTYAFGPVTDGAGLNVTVISTDDRVGFGITACSDLVPQVWDLADAIAPALDELTAAAKGLRAPTGRRAGAGPRLPGRSPEPPPFARGCPCRDLRDVALSRMPLTARATTAGEVETAMAGRTGNTVGEVERQLSPAVLAPSEPVFLTPPSAQVRRHRRRWPWIVGSLVFLVAAVVGVVWLTSSVARPVTMRQAESRLGTRGIAAADAARPAPGVYGYSGTGTEKLSLPPLSQAEGPSMPGTVTLAGSNCFVFRIDYSTHHWQTWRYCLHGRDTVGVRWPVMAAVVHRPAPCHEPELVQLCPSQHGFPGRGGCRRVMDVELHRHEHLGEGKDAEHRSLPVRGLHHRVGRRYTSPGRALPAVADGLGRAARHGALRGLVQRQHGVAAARGVAGHQGHEPDALRHLDLHPGRVLRPRFDGSPSRTVGSRYEASTRRRLGRDPCRALRPVVAWRHDGKRRISTLPRSRHHVHPGHPGPRQRAGAGADQDRELEHHKAQEWVGGLVRANRRRSETIISTVSGEVRKQFRGLGLAKQDDLAHSLRPDSLRLDSLRPDSILQEAGDRQGRGEVREVGRRSRRPGPYESCGSRSGLLGHDHGLVRRATAPHDPLGSQPRGGQGRGKRAREPRLPARLLSGTRAVCHRRSGAGRCVGRFARGGRSDVGLQGRARGSQAVRSPVDPGREPFEGSRARLLPAHDRSGQAGPSRAPCRRPHRAEHRHRDHAGQGGGVVATEDLAWRERSRRWSPAGSFVST